MRKIILPSILSADFCKMGEEVAMLEQSGADMIHCDVMDGTFVGPITFGAQMVKGVRNITSLPLDVHLMIVHPETQIERFAKAGADFITVHYEAYHADPNTEEEKIRSVLKNIRDFGVKCGLVINPATPVEVLKPYLSLVDLILVMSVVPGYGGQKFIPSSLEKVKALVRRREEASLSFAIEIDGGVTEENASVIREAGVDMLVAGSAVFKAPDKARAIRKLRGEA